MEFFKATAADITGVVSVYDAVRSRGFCVWSEQYPTALHAEADEKAGCLYVLKDGDKVIGCASVEPIAEDNDLPFWRINDGTHREISRVAIRARDGERTSDGIKRTRRSLCASACRKEKSARFSHLSVAGIRFSR